jgi:AraC family transcriptional regulator, alkane utilization regulator
MQKTVARFADGDIAEELLRDFRIESSVLCRSVMVAPWGFGVAGGAVGSFHMVLQGRGWLEVDGVEEAIPVRTGDLVVIPKGRPHWVKDSPTTIAPSLDSILANNDVVDGELHFGGEEGPSTEIVCGVFAVEGAGKAPWVERLPPVVVSPSTPGRSAWRATAAEALRNEARDPSKGGATVVNRLLESLLADALRVKLAELATDATAPRQAVADERIGRVLARLHASPEEPWTVGRMAGVAAMSRSAFADRFRSLVGEAPKEYLSRLRLARAARLIRTTDATLGEIATRVGYGSGETLSRAFKLHFGKPPSSARQRLD